MHVVGRSESDTKAKFLVFLANNKGAPILCQQSRRRNHRQAEHEPKKTANALDALPARMLGLPGTVENR